MAKQDYTREITVGVVTAVVGVFLLWLVGAFVKKLSDLDHQSIARNLKESDDFRRVLIESLKADPSLKGAPGKSASANDIATAIAADNTLRATFVTELSQRLTGELQYDGNTTLWLKRTNENETPAMKRQGTDFEFTVGISPTGPKTPHEIDREFGGDVEAVWWTPESHLTNTTNLLFDMFVRKDPNNARRVQLDVTSNQQSTGQDLKVRIHVLYRSPPSNK